MTPAAVTGALLHDLVAGSHAEGITALGVETVIEHDDAVLLVAEPGPDFTDDTWQLPAGPVLPGQTLTDALHPAIAAIGLTIDEVTGYLGHHDHAGAPGDHPSVPLRCHRHRSRRHLPARRDRPPLGGGPGRPGRPFPRR